MNRKFLGMFAVILIAIGASITLVPRHAVAGKTVAEATVDCWGNVRVVSTHTSEWEGFTADIVVTLNGESRTGFAGVDAPFVTEFTFTVDPSTLPLTLTGTTQWDVLKEWQVTVPVAPACPQQLPPPTGNVDVTCQYDETTSVSTYVPTTWIDPAGTPGEIVFNPPTDSNGGWAPNTAVTWSILWEEGVVDGGAFVTGNGCEPIKEVSTPEVEFSCVAAEADMPGRFLVFSEGYGQFGGYTDETGFFGFGANFIDGETSVSFVADDDTVTTLDGTVDCITTQTVLTA